MTDLKQFIDTTRAQAEMANTFEWSKRRDTWICSLDDLFKQIISWLREAGLEKENLELGAKDLSEETLGRYTAPTLSVHVAAGLVIDFNPVASVIIGGYGRVDVTARRGLQKIMLIATDADERKKPRETPSYERQWTWCIFEPGNSRRPTAFDQAGLTDLLTKLAS